MEKNYFDAIFGILPFMSKEKHSVLRNQIFALLPKHMRIEVREQGVLLLHHG